ncbi:MAG: hypothetical protein IJ654_03180 [Bacteroidales bacterium]|nr:hypothetical protein [Bacteroidales bacterium]
MIYTYHQGQEREKYLPPVSSQWPFQSDTALCQTSFTGNEIDPGTGSDWGTF